jgi:pimeloyl-ACP methyl ester carboxylesterase
MRFAVTTKISIKKIVVVDIAPKYYEPHHQREIAALKGINLSTLTSRQEADDIMAKTIPELMVRQFLMKGLYRAESGSFHWRFNLDVIASQIENIGEAQNIELASKTPTLFIKGEKSNYYINESDTDLIKKLFPNSNIIIIPNAGHWVQAEQPQLFYEAVESFFA